MATKSKPNEIQITRVYDASVKLVWDAWTDPKQVEQWWGPRGFTLTTHSKELKPGGHWAYTMHGPDGKNYENKTIYYEVEKYSRLVYDHGGNDDRPPLFRVTVDFTEIGKNKTKMDMTMALATAEAANETRKFIKQASGNSTWDRLAEYLEKESTGKEQFVINRSFEASLGMMFDMWTDPKQFAQWLPPTGFKMEFRRAEMKPGGTAFYLMSNGQGVEMYGRIKYLDISRPHRLVYTQQFCDEKEQVIRPSFLKIWPETVLTTVVFAEEGPDQTRVTVTTEAFGQPSREEIEAFVNLRTSMTQGWTGSLDKLEDLVASKK